MGKIDTFNEAALVFQLRGMGLHGCPHAAATVGDYLSGVCWLESAAVAAFMQLANELKTHNAPEHLIRGAIEAAAEEIGHAGLRASTRFEPTPILVREAGVPTSAQVTELLDHLNSFFG